MLRAKKMQMGRVALAASAVTTMLTGFAGAQELDAVTFGTGWLAQAEHGGFYQAVADGTYEKFGLDVTIMMGGPQSPNRARLTAGQVQFLQGSTLGAFDAVSQDIPTTTVAAIFQKEPLALLTHPTREFKTLEDLTALETLYLGGDGYDTFFRWMKATYPGFKDEQYAPYTYNPATFIADENSGQQAYVTSEPLDIENQTGWAPGVFLLADYGYSGYATTIETQVDLVENDPDLVQRFVDASIIGWYNYLWGDAAAANALIQADNPEMTDEQIAYSREKLRELGIVLSGDAKTSGIGCMTDARYDGFFSGMRDAGVLDAALDYKKAYTTEFVCKSVGADLFPDAVAAAQ